MEIKGLNERDKEQLRQRAATDGCALTQAFPLSEEMKRVLVEDIGRQGGELMLALDRAERRMQGAGEFSSARLFAIARERIEEANMWAAKAITR